MKIVKTISLVLLAALLTAVVVTLLMPIDVLHIDVFGALPVLLIFAGWLFTFFGGQDGTR